MNSALADIAEDHVARGTAPGIVIVDGRPDGSIETIAAGDLPSDAIVRIQSMTKPILAVATLRLVHRGQLSLDDPVERWLPELAERRVLRTPDADLDDTVPATRPITVRHLLTNTSGYGMMARPVPLQQAMIDGGTRAGQEPLALGADEWLAALAALPLAFQPGEGWRYHHSFGILGIMLARLVGGDLGAHLARDVFDPLGMRDTGYVVPTSQAHRLVAAYRHDPAGGLREIEPAGAGFYVAPAPFDLSHGELLSTASDFSAFAAMLARGGSHAGEQYLDPALLAAMRSDQVPAAVKTDDSFFPGFWNATGWGYGVSVVIEGPHAGRFGWSGGLGTDFFVDPDGGFRVVMTQVEMGPQVMELFTDLQ